MNLEVQLIHMADIVSELECKYKQRIFKPRLLRKAIREIDKNTKIILELWQVRLYGKNKYRVEATLFELAPGSAERSKYFRFLKSANLYFEKLLKRHKLEEVDLLADSI